MNKHIASCQFELKATATGIVQIFPAGDFRALDGRPDNATAWRVDADAVLTDLDTRANDIPVYYEHQDIHAEANGQPAPAAGWIKPTDIEWMNNGLFAVSVNWTQRAKDFITNREYRFISPLFEHEKDGRITRLLNISLVNSPAIDGMNAVTAKHQQTPEDAPPMIPQPILKALGLPEDADEAAVLEAIKQLKGDATPHELETALKDALTQLEIMKLEAADKEREELISSNAAKLATPGLIAWAKRQPVAALKEYLQDAPEIAALKGMQSAGRMPKDAPPKQTGIESAVERLYGSN